MANSIPTYTKIPIPFANSGDKNSIPQNATGNNLASYSEGFPPITSQPITENGIPPEREDFNGLGFSTTNNISYLQQGGLYTFDTQLSSAIGGYAQGAILAYINNGQLYYLRSKINNNTYNFNTNSSYIGQYWEYAFGQGNTGGFSIGSIFAYPSALPPEGAYLLNGQTITNCQTLYADFWNWLNDGVTNNYIRTLTNSAYEAELAEYGMCGAFVISGSDVRLPKWNGYQTTLGDSVPVIGNGLTMGLTDGANTYGLRMFTPGISARSNSIAGETLVGTNVGHGGNMLLDEHAVGVTTDPTKSGIIADTSGLYPDRWSWVIQVFNTATDLSNQESAQLASQMQMKAQKDFGNVDNNIDFVVDSYDDGQGNWYRVYRSGWVEQGGYFVFVDNTKFHSISLNYPFADDKYNVQISTEKKSSSANGQYQGYCVYDRQTTYFQTRTADSAGVAGAIWYACGQGAN